VTIFADRITSFVQIFFTVHCMDCDVQAVSSSLTSLYFLLSFALLFCVVNILVKSLFRLCTTSVIMFVITIEEVHFAAGFWHSVVCGFCQVLYQSSIVCGSVCHKFLQTALKLNCIGLMFCALDLFKCLLIQMFFWFYKTPDVSFQTGTFSAFLNVKPSLETLQMFYPAFLIMRRSITVVRCVRVYNSGV